MTHRRKIVVRILLFICRMVNDDSELTKELESLAMHINLIKEI